MLQQKTSQQMGWVVVSRRSPWLDAAQLNKSFCYVAVGQNYPIPQKNLVVKGKWWIEGFLFDPQPHDRNEEDLLAGPAKMALQPQSTPKTARPCRRESPHPKQRLDKEQRNFSGSELFRYQVQENVSKVNCAWLSRTHLSPLHAGLPTILCRFGVRSSWLG